MGGAFRIGRVAGIDLKVHWTFFLLLAFYAFAGYQGSGSLTNALVTALIIVALFVCVVLHEYGHSLVAQRLGIEIQDITVQDRTSTRLNSSHANISYAVFCLKKKHRERVQLHDDVPEELKGGQESLVRTEHLPDQT